MKIALTVFLLSLKKIEDLYGSIMNRVIFNAYESLTVHCFLINKIRYAMRKVQSITFTNFCLKHLQ